MFASISDRWERTYAHALARSSALSDGYAFSKSPSLVDKRRACSRSHTGIRVRTIRASPPLMSGWDSMPGKESPRSCTTQRSNSAFSARLRAFNIFSICGAIDIATSSIPSQLDATQFSVVPAASAPFTATLSRSAKRYFNSHRLGHRRLGQQGSICCLGAVGIRDLDVIGFVAGHHLVARDAVGDGVHDRPLRGGCIPAALRFGHRKLYHAGAAKVHL